MHSAATDGMLVGRRATTTAPTATDRRNAFGQCENTCSISITSASTGRLAADDQLVEERRVPHDPGAAVDPQRVVPAGDQRDEPDVRVGQDVEVPVGPFVAGALSDGDGAGVEHVDEVAARVALGEASQFPSASDVASTQNGDRPQPLDLQRMERGPVLGRGATGREPAERLPQLRR